jgi:hypothetical protein
MRKIASFATFAASLGSIGSSSPTRVLTLEVWQRLTASSADDATTQAGSSNYVPLGKPISVIIRFREAMKLKPISVGWEHGAVGRALRPTTAAAEPYCATTISAVFLGSRRRRRK